MFRKQTSVFYPISIDRWLSPISSLLRAVAERNSQFLTHSFSRPDGGTDMETVKKFWDLPWVHRVGLTFAVKNYFTLGHVASCSWKNVAMLRLARWASGGKMKIVYTVNVEPHDYDANKRWMAWLVTHADHLVSVSSAVANAVEAKWGRRAECIIPNGADAEYFTPAVGAWPLPRPRFVFVGTVTQRKRPDVFFAMAKRIPEADFVIVGPPGPTDEMARYAELTQGRSNILFAGLQSREQVRDWLNLATALLFPSDLEGLPLSVIEGQMMGVPTVAQPVSCMPEIIHPHKNGFLVPAVDLDGWEAKCRELMEAPQNKPGSEWRQGIREVAVQKYSWDGVATAYIEFYQQVIA
jgi:glycosyltransferase involved in cell wall biosynthesis